MSLHRPVLTRPIIAFLCVSMTVWLQGTGTLNLEAAVKELGCKTSYKEIPGRHYWFLWRDFLGDYASLLFK